MKYVLKRLFGEEFNNLLLLNLLTVGLCIPVVTAGPAILAMKGTLVKILDDRCDLRRIHEFWGLFKKKFWKGLLFEVLFILYGMMLLWCKSLADNVGGSAGRAARVHRERLRGDDSRKRADAVFAGDVECAVPGHRPPAAVAGERGVRVRSRVCGVPAVSVFAAVRGGDPASDDVGALADVPVGSAGRAGV